MQRPLRVSESATISGSGDARVKLGPILPNVRWDLATASIKVDNSVKIPQCSVYVGPIANNTTFIDGTYSGSLNSTARVASYPLTPGTYVWAVWSGGSPGGVATLTVFGNEILP